MKEEKIHIKNASSLKYLKGLMEYTQKYSGDVCYIINGNRLDNVEIFPCPNCQNVDLVQGICPECGYGSTNLDLQIYNISSEININFVDYSYCVYKLGLKGIRESSKKPVIEYVKFKYKGEYYKLKLKNYEIKNGKIIYDKILGIFTKKINGSYEGVGKSNYEDIGGLDRVRILVLNILKKYYELS